MKYYIRYGNKSFRPLTLEQLLELWKQGKLPPETEFMTDSMPQWQYVSEYIEVLELLGTSVNSLSAPTKTIPSQSGIPTPPRPVVPKPPEQSSTQPVAAPVPMPPSQQTATNPSASDVYQFELVDWQLLLYHDRLQIVYKSLRQVYWLDKKQLVEETTRTVLPLQHITRVEWGTQQITTSNLTLRIFGIVGIFFGGILYLLLVVGALEAESFGLICISFLVGVAGLIMLIVSFRQRVDFKHMIHLYTSGHIYTIEVLGELSEGLLQRRTRFCEELIRRMMLVQNRCTGGQNNPDTPPGKASPG
ncbi:MAG: DUF4339 domain-containing protein [Gemmataceae bacterium]